MTRSFVIEGPEAEVEELRQELLRDLPRQGVDVGDVGEQPPDILDNGEFGEVALVEFVVSVASDVTADVLVAISAMLYAKVRSRKKVKVRDEESPVSSNESE